MKKAFVIQAVGGKGSETRKRADNVLHGIIEPACEQTGYEAIRANELNTHTIAEPIISALNTHPLAIADLGHPPWNSNVLTEVGFRLATGRPIIFLTDVDPKPDIVPLHLRNVRIHIIDPTTLTEQDVANLVESIKRYGPEVKYWESDHPTIEFVLSPQSEDGGRVIFANRKAAQVHGLNDAEDLIGKPLREVDRLLEQFIPVGHWKAFSNDQERLVGSIYAPRNDDPRSAMVPLWLPNHDNPYEKGKVYWPVLVQYRFDQDDPTGGARNSIVMRVIYIDVTVWDPMVPPPRETSQVLKVPDLFRPTSAEHDIFLSYNSRDGDYVRELVAALKRFGLKVWYDEDDLSGEGSLARELLRQANRSSILAMVIGRNGLGRWQAEVELQSNLLAHCRGKKPFLVLLLPDVEKRKSFTSYIPAELAQVLDDIPQIQLPPIDELKKFGEVNGRRVRFAERLLQFVVKTIRGSDRV